MLQVGNCRMHLLAVLFLWLGIFQNLLYKNICLTDIAGKMKMSQTNPAQSIPQQHPTYLQGEPRASTPLVLLFFCFHCHRRGLGPPKTQSWIFTPSYLCSPQSVCNEKTDLL